MDAERVADAVWAAGAVARGDVSAAELLEHHRRRIVDGADRWNAVVDTDFAGAAVAAADIDRRVAAGAEVGALAGVPMTLKDSFDVGGMRTTHGRRSDAHRAATDAPAVARLRAADAVPFGKSNVPVLLAGYQTANEDFGRTLNPWAPDRAPGGSSGGAAVAVATGRSTIELGSDLAGSIRIPAAWNGIFGHRPSNGVVSKRGHLPWREGSLIEPPNSVSGPLARSARDLERVLPLIAGASAPDDAAWRLELPPAPWESLQGLRVGVWSQCAVAPVTAEMRRALAALAASMESLGARIVPLDTVPLDTVPGADADGLALFDRLMNAEIAHSADPEAVASVAAMPGTIGQLVHDHWRDLETQRRIRAEWERAVFAHVDVVLAPAVHGAAPLWDDRPVEERLLDIDGVPHPAAATISAWSRIPNLAMLPCTVVPMGPGAETGQPMGAQLIGRYLHDRTTLRVASLLERDDVVRFVSPLG